MKRRARKSRPRGKPARSTRRKAKRNPPQWTSRPPHIPAIDWNRQTGRRESPQQLGLFGSQSQRQRPKAGKKRRSSAARSGAACGCNRRCCKAAGQRCACRCHGRNHGGGRVLSNPPGRKGSHKIPCERFPGQPISLRYRRGGQVFEHKLGPGVQMLKVKGASALVLRGVRVNPYLEG